MTLKKSFFKWMHTPIFWAVVIALIYAAVTLYITIHLMHDSYNTDAFDLGIFSQELKYTLQGKILYSLAIGASQFAPHFSPVLFLLVPIYWLFPYPQMLLVVQGLLLAFGGYLIYVLAREYNYSHRASLILEGLFFINPLIWGVALFDFHTEAIAIPALLVMFFGLKKKSWLFFIIGLLFILASKEDIVLTLGVFGFVLMIYDYRQHKRVEKMSVIIFCSAIFTYGLGILVSHLASTGEPTRMLSYITNRYAYIGKPLSEAIPMAARTIFSKGSLFLIAAYLAPFVFLPLLSPKWCIPALVILLSGILSTSVGQHIYLSQYQGVAIPFLFMAFMEVLPIIVDNQKIQLYTKIANNHMVTYSLITIVLISFVIISKGRIQRASLPDEHAEAVNQEIALIPNNATVTASNIDFPHLCSRTNTYLDAWEGYGLSFGSGIQNFDWGFPDKDTEYVLIDYKDTSWYKTELSLMSKNYKLIKSIDGVFLYQLNK